MEIQFFGANCFRLSNKKASLVVDDNLKTLGSKQVVNNNDVALYTLDKPESSDARFLVCGPGEYEISEISIVGIPAKAHIDADGHRSTLYTVRFGDINFGIIGHAYPELTEDQLEKLGLIDILLIPVGGNGYTIDAVGATKLVKKIEPKIVIPSHYAESKLNYEVPQASVEEFLKAMGATDAERVDGLKIKESDLIGDKTRVVILNN